MQFEFDRQETAEFRELARNPHVKRFVNKFFVIRSVQLMQSMVTAEEDTELRWKQGRIQELQDWVDELEKAIKEA